MLDIGDDVGALVVTLDGELGSELHVRPAGRPDAPTVHTGVWARPTGNRAVVVAVFPQLHEGVYDILGADGAPRQTVTITGGRVAEIALA